MLTFQLAVLEFTLRSADLTSVNRLAKQTSCAKLQFHLMCRAMKLAQTLKRTVIMLDVKMTFLGRSPRYQVNQNDYGL